MYINIRSNSIEPSYLLGKFAYGLQQGIGITLPAQQQKYRERRKGADSKRCPPPCEVSCRLVSLRILPEDFGRFWYVASEEFKSPGLLVHRLSHAQIGAVSAPICAFYRRSLSGSSIVSARICPLQSCSGSKVGQALADILRRIAYNRTIFITMKRSRL